MFPLHAPTLAFMLTVVTVTTSVLLFISWLQNRDVAALRWWSLANLLCGAALPLLGMRGHAPPFLTIDIANALLYLGFGAGWVGFRRFARRDISWAALFAPTLIWMALCRWEPFYNSVDWRLIIGSAIIAGYSIASAWELYRLRGERLVSRYPAIAWLLVHAICFGVRIPLAFVLPVPATNEIVTSPWFSMLTFEGLLNVIAMSFLQIALIRERAENLQREAAMTDLLTGAPNRRALFQDGARLLARADAEKKPLCGLLIDIDHFKSINDRFGHDGGDVVLIGVADAMRTHLRGADFFARLGGEEFVCLLPDTSMQAAMLVAEGLRARVASLKLRSSERDLRVSVSIGVARASGVSIDELLREADRNLYEAKALGRNRVSATTTQPPQEQLRVA